MYADVRHRIELFPEFTRVHSDSVDLTFEIRMTKGSNAQTDFEIALVVAAVLAGITQRQVVLPRPLVPWKTNR